VIERPKLQNVAFETIAAPKTLAVDMVRMGDPRLGEFDEDRVPSAASFLHKGRSETFPPGSVHVPSDQPLAILAAQLPEAESPDGRCDAHS
jgi:hypothetical protein